MTQSVSGFVYFLGAIPGGTAGAQFRIQSAIIVGLGCLSVGAFVLYPAAEMHAFSYFLGAIAMMSCGWILLEIAANPFVACLGRAETFVCRSTWRNPSSRSAS